MLVAAIMPAKVGVLTACREICDAPVAQISGTNMRINEMNVMSAGRKRIFAPSAAYSATPAAVASLDLQTGILTDVVTGMVSPHGMAFINK